MADVEAPSAAIPVTNPVMRVLAPGSEAHNKLRDHLKDRLDFSERRMSAFYARWQANELRAQAYIALPDYKDLVKNAVDEGKPPQVVNIVVPYSFSAMQTICTYLLHTFTGRKPIFPISSYSASYAEAAIEMEKVVDYNCVHTRMPRHMWQFFNDTMNYGVGIFRCLFKHEKGMRSRWRIGQQHFMDQLLDVPNRSQVREMATIFQGNEIECVDPFMFFPDPRVGMGEVSKKGEFCFFRCWEDRLLLKKQEAKGEVFYIDKVERLDRQNQWGESRRNLMARGNQFTSGRDDGLRGSLKEPVQVDHGTCEIIPRDFGIGEESFPIKWYFKLGNKNQIIFAEPFTADHDRHPVAVSEPYALGYGFGQAGLADYMAPLQDLMSWLVNTHMFNVRAVLNNQFLVDPSKIEMQDLKNPSAGKIIRLKAAAYGQDVRVAIQQLQVQDITRAHLSDLQVIMRLADSLSGATDNLRGLQDGGGRKTATEIRGSMDAGASRLAALAKIISSQAVVDLTEMMVLNIQQYMEQEFYVRLLGQHPADLLLKPDNLTGDFYFPVHDGTLPMDKVALFDIWNQMFATTLQDMQLRQTFDIVRIFEWVAKLGGAQNMEQYRLAPSPQMNLVPAPQGAIDQATQAGNIISLPTASGVAGAIPPPAGPRAAGGM